MKIMFKCLEEVAYLLSKKMFQKQGKGGGVSNCNKQGFIRKEGGGDIPREK